jgi:hypothetical protein
MKLLVIVSKNEKSYGYAVNRKSGVNSKTLEKVLNKIFAEYEILQITYQR